MSGTVVLVLDGVLRREGTNAVNLQGLRLYHALASTGRLAILCGEDVEMAEWFLRSNGLSEHAYLIGEDKRYASSVSGRREYQLSQLRAQGAHVEFVVEPNPDVAAYLFSIGVPVLVYLHPQYSQPSFRPDYGRTATPWDSLQAEIDYQIAMRVKDTRSVVNDE